VQFVVAKSPNSTDALRAVPLNVCPFLHTGADASGTNLNEFLHV